MQLIRTIEQSSRVLLSTAVVPASLLIGRATDAQPVTPTVMDPNLDIRVAANGLVTLGAVI